MRRNKSQSFLPGFNFKTATISHGGELARGKRKTARPIDPKQALHVVLRSSKARGDYSMLRPKHCKHIHEFTHKIAKQLGIRIYRYANVGNHIHLLIKVPNRRIWQHFLRQLAGGIAIIVTGAKKGMALDQNQNQRGFWDQLTFTRIIRFGKDFKNLCFYMLKNIFEASGIPMKKLIAEGYHLRSLLEDGFIITPPSLPS